MLISILVAIGVPLVFLYMIWGLEIYAVSRLSLLIGGVAWGVASFWAAYTVHNALVAQGVANTMQITVSIAPVTEELLKAALLIWLASRLRLRYAVDGIAYGFAIGTGFTVVENLLYISNNPTFALEIAIARVLSTSLVHAFDTAIVGGLAGCTVCLGARGRVPRLLAGLGIAIGSHGLFNYLANHIQGAPLILVGVLFGLGGTALLVALIGRSLRAESRWIESGLTDLPAGEMAAILNPQQVAQLLAQHRQIIGSRRADAAQKYVSLRAQQAILRKTLAFSQQKRRVALAGQLETIDQKIRSLRSAMGLYTWLWLRTILPSDEDTVWTHLNAELSSDQPLLETFIARVQQQASVLPTELAARKTLLRATRIFNHLNNDDLEDVALLLREKRYAPGATVIQQNDVSDQLYVIAAGTLSASAEDEDGHEAALNRYGRGDTFGELSLLDFGAYPATVTCADDVHLYTLPRADLMTLLYTSPQVALDMLRALAGDSRRQTARLVQSAAADQSAAYSDLFRRAAFAYPPRR